MREKTPSSLNVLANIRAPGNMYQLRLLVNVDHATYSLIPLRISRITLYANSEFASLSSEKPRDNILNASISLASMSSRVACQGKIRLPEKIC